MQRHGRSVARIKKELIAIHLSFRTFKRRRAQLNLSIRFHQGCLYISHSDLTDMDNTLFKM